MRRSIHILLACTLLLLQAGCQEETKSSVETRATPKTVDVKRVTVAYTPVQDKLALVGQVNPTEHGRADVTTPLQGVVIQPLVKVGQYVGEGTPLAEINNVYGQTSMQLVQKVEADQASVLTAENAVQQAMANLGQARSTLAAAETTAAQSVDSLAQARAELVNATTDQRRKSKLLTAGVSAQADVDDARERYAKAKAAVADMQEEVRIARRAVDLARANLGPLERNVRFCENSVAIAQRQVSHDEVIAEGARNPSGSQETQFYVRSPIPGVVIAMSMSAGLAVSPGTIVASVVDTRNVYVDANAYESDLQGVRSGEPIEVHADGFPGQSFKGTVAYIGRQVDPTTRTVSVRCLIHNQGDDLRPGLFVQAILTPPSPRKALMVPNQAILIQGREHYVVVSPDGKTFEKRIIEEGVRTGTATEVLKGLKPGEQVVTQGNILVIPQ